MRARLLAEQGNQQSQLDAIQAAVDLFEGQPLAGGPFEFRYESLTGLGFTELGVGNQLTLGAETLLRNLRTVQARGEIPLDEAVNPDALHFTVEMETGTGKTYVYLRTLYELNAKYGLTKFVIVVPTVDF